MLIEAISAILLASATILLIKCIASIIFDSDEASSVGRKMMIIQAAIFMSGHSAVMRSDGKRLKLLHLFNDQL